MNKRNTKPRSMKEVVVAALLCGLSIIMLSKGLLSIGLSEDMATTLGLSVPIFAVSMWLARRKPICC